MVLVHQLTAESSDRRHPPPGQAVGQEWCGRFVLETNVWCRHDRLPDGSSHAVVPGVCSAPVIRDCDPPERMEGHHGATGAALTLRFVVGIGEDLEDQMPTAARGSGSLEPLSNGRKVVDVDVPGPVVGRGPPRRSLTHVKNLSARCTSDLESVEDKYRGS